MRRAVLLAALVSVAAGPASAHGLRLTLAAEAGCLSGRITYSDGWPGEGETAVVTRMGAGAAPLSIVADADGRFSTTAAPGRHLVKVSGDEEHEVQREIDVPAGAAAAACRPAEPSLAGAKRP